MTLRMAKATLRARPSADQLQAEWAAIWDQIRALPPTDHPDSNIARPASPAYLALEALSCQIATRHRRLVGWNR